MAGDEKNSRGKQLAASLGSGDCRRFGHADLRAAAACLLLLLALRPGNASAEWTGISMDFANNTSDWKFRSETRQARNSEFQFSIEERTASGLAVGVAIGYFDMRLAGSTDLETIKFDGQYFRIYLRQDYAMTDKLSLHGGLGFKYASGTESGSAEERPSIDWNETDVEIGIGFLLGNLRVMPFAAWNDVDGDISGAAGTSTFGLERPDTLGIRFDLFVERTAFVGLELTSGSHSGGKLMFVRRY